MIDHEMMPSEDTADLAAVNVFRHRSAVGVEDLVPASIAERIPDGENRSHVRRDHRGLEPADLAEAAAITPKTLAEVEAGRHEASLPVQRGDRPLTRAGRSPPCAGPAAPSSHRPA